jgi:hypothetical protein
MKIKKISCYLAIGMLGFSMLACNLGKGPAQVASTPSQSPTSESSSATQPPTGNDAANHACANPYLPIIAGAAWNYSLTGSATDTFTRSILSVDENEFTEQDVFGAGVTRQGKWSCDNGSLIALDPANGPSAGVSSYSLDVDFQTKELSGVTLPATIHAGDTWSQSITLEGTSTISGQSIPAKNHTTSDCTAVGLESVTVPAGTFDAMRIDCKVSIHITITMNGTDIPTNLNMNSTNWYAEKVGLIKAVSSGAGFDSTIELTSYTIP